MKKVDVTELRQNLPSYLEQVRRGERIKVSSRGRVVAEIAPPTASAEEVTAARKLLRGSLVYYVDPLELAFAPSEWDVNR